MGELWCDGQAEDEGDWAAELVESFDGLPRLRRVTGEDLKQASREFRAGTSRAPDGLHVTSFQYLQADGLTTFARIWEAIERAGVFPSQISRLQVTGTPKAQGRGVRPIGGYPALFRLGLKARRGDFQAFDRRIDRDVFSASAG